MGGVEDDPVLCDDRPRHRLRTAEVSEQERRLTDFYREHNPAKLPEVRATVERYVGRYDTMWRRLRAKYVQQPQQQQQLQQQDGQQAAAVPPGGKQPLPKPAARRTVRLHDGGGARLDPASDEEGAAPSAPDGSALDHVPASFRHRLKQHQKEGIDFVWQHLARKGRGCVLAHCMGLGKTLQALTVLAALVRSGAAKRVCVIVPPTLVAPWASEARRWGFAEAGPESLFPCFEVVTSELHPVLREAAIRRWSRADGGSVLLTTYPRLAVWATKAIRPAATDGDRRRRRRRSSSVGSETTDDEGPTPPVKRRRRGSSSEPPEAEPLPGAAEACGGAEPAEVALVREELFGVDAETPGADVVVLDEAQAIKNEGARATRACRAFRTRRRLAMTGTPMQNSVPELHSLLDFVRPGFLSKGKMLSFVKPIEDSMTPTADRELLIAGHSKAQVLSNQLRKYIHRRDQGVLSAVLPPLRQHVIVVSLSDLQATLYGHLGRTMSSARQDGKLFLWKTVSNRILAHPGLLRRFLRDQLGNPAQAGELRGLVGGVSSRFISGDEFAWLERTASVPEWARQSPKLQITRELVAAAAAAGEAVLIFSAYTEVLDVIQEYLLSDEGCCGTVARMDGAVSIPERDVLVRDMQSGRTRVMLLTYGVGGQGLTLTRATRVVLFEPHWNWAQIQQAVFRTYRFGQSAPVFTYQLVGDGTFEREVLSLMLRKEWMHMRVINDEEATRRHIRDRDTAAYFRYKPTKPRAPAPELLEADAVLRSAAAAASAGGAQRPLICDVGLYSVLLASDGSAAAAWSDRRAGENDDADWRREVDLSQWQEVLAVHNPSMPAGRGQSAGDRKPLNWLGPGGMLRGNAGQAAREDDDRALGAAHQRQLRTVEDIAAARAARELAAAEEAEAAAETQARDRERRLQQLAAARQAAAESQMKLFEQSVQYNQRVAAPSCHPDVRAALALVGEHTRRIPHDTLKALLPFPVAALEPLQCVEVFVAQAFAQGIRSFTERLACMPGPGTFGLLQDGLGLAVRDWIEAAVSPSEVSGVMREWLSRTREWVAKRGSDEPLPCDPGPLLDLISVVAAVIRVDRDKLTQAFMCNPSAWYQLPEWLKALIGYAVDIDVHVMLQFFRWGLQCLLADMGEGSAGAMNTAALAVGAELDPDLQYDYDHLVNRVSVAMTTPRPQSRAQPPRQCAYEVVL